MKKTVEIWGMNNHVICEPLETGWEKRVESNGLVMTSTKAILLKAKVAFNSEGDLLGVLSAGDEIYFPYDQTTAPWAKKVFELDGKRVIFVPAQSVLAASRQLAQIENELC